MDERLRALERQAEHDPDAAARLLQERVRRGLLDEARLGLAAHLGHACARRALGLAPAPADEGAPTELEAWLARLAPWGRVAFVRALTAAAHAVVPRFEALAPEDGRARAALAAASAWCDAPSVASARTARAAARQAQRAAQDVGRRADFRAEWQVDTPELYAAYHAAHLCAHAANAVVLDLAPPTPVLEQAADAFGRALERTGAPVAGVLAAARETLLAWALGSVR